MLILHIRSVHNTRIERIWYDVTRGFGIKWKKFFIDLELHFGLDPHNPAHIWLLHHLFLSIINDDAVEWVAGWNSHRLGIQGERAQSPREMFLISMVSDGPRGIRQVQSHATDEDVGDLASYGIDWQVAHDHRLMTHLLDNNLQEWEEENPFVGQPLTYSDVPCEPPNCPLSDEQVRLLDSALLERVDLMSRNMTVRRLIWQEGLQICTFLMELP